MMPEENKDLTEGLTASAEESEIWAYVVLHQNHGLRPRPWSVRLSIKNYFHKGFPCGSAGKESAYNARDLGWEDPLEKGNATYSGVLT